MDEVLERLIDDLEGIPKHDPGACRVVDRDEDGFCTTCALHDMVIEAINEARRRVTRIRLGIAA